ncbi:hypothetical protein CPB83DRAFT_895548 [Crepidotus variabilis]|uniref:Adenosine deaminase domain-containing protein n=1 Tax=Crepidotus variabilis TaxID=179855 RepID=A0A9P6JNY9_9AGAR|nr:hypothetical protein CPB83DRAFT_895548 [Crepidotus variabilis]
MEVAGPAAQALKSLTSAQLDFLRLLPKAELHAHLNGSIPLSTLKELATEFLATNSASSKSGDAVREGIEILTVGPTLDELNDFFSLFPAIYALTSTPDALARATRAVLSVFLDGDVPQCSYLELRTTPKKTGAMDMEKYIRVVLEEMDRYGREKVALIVSTDRRMDTKTLEAIVGLACKLREEGERVVGIDLCGDPLAGEMDLFAPYFARAKQAGLGLTLHIAETIHNTPQDTLKLLKNGPDRLGHATFLNEEAIAIVLEKKMCIEICLTSNLICKTASDLETHHIQQYLKVDHPITICTDDILPFKTSLVAEYALLIARPPFGLGLNEAQVKRIAEMSLEAAFK